MLQPVPVKTNTTTEKRAMTRIIACWCWRSTTTIFLVNIQNPSCVTCRSITPWILSYRFFVTFATTTTTKLFVNRNIIVGRNRYTFVFLSFSILNKYDTMCSNFFFLFSGSRTLYVRGTFVTLLSGFHMFCVCADVAWESRYSDWPFVMAWTQWLANLFKIQIRRLNYFVAKHDSAWPLEFRWMQWWTDWYKMNIVIGHDMQEKKSVTI